MNTPSHLEETLQRDIALVKHKVKLMGERSVSALKSSVEAVVKRDRRLAYLVILRDQHIDELETELDKFCLEFLVRHQPAGAHLRLIYAAIQVNKELERIGDYAESIAKQVPVLSSVELGTVSARLIELGSVATQMVASAMQAFLKEDEALAWRTMEQEETANTLRDRLNAELPGWAEAGQLPANAVTPLTTVARRLERAADQAKNICEDVLYLCTGEFVKHKSAEGFRILFVDQHNSTLSQLGEAIGKAMKLPRFTFSSAGIDPKPISEELKSFLAGKALEVSGLESKPLQKVPNWESSHVVVLLDPEVRPHLRGLSNKTITLDWQPGGPGGPAGKDRQSLESASQFLESNIRDLAGAILEAPTVST